MQLLIIILLLIVIGLLLRINSKLPGRDPVEEALEKYRNRDQQN